MEFLNKNPNVDVKTLALKIDEIFNEWFGSDIYKADKSSNIVAKEIIDASQIENINQK